MELEIIVRDAKNLVVYRRVCKTNFIPTEFVLEKPFEVDGYLIKSFALGVEREKIRRIEKVGPGNYQTKLSEPVNILTTLAQGKNPVVGLVSKTGGGDLVMRWDAYGRVDGDPFGQNNLHEVKKP